MVVWGFLRPRTCPHYLRSTCHRKTFVNNLPGWAAQVDRNERIMSQVLRERSQHRGEAAVRPGWFVVSVVSVVVVLTLVGIHVALPQHAGPESSSVDGSEAG